jgi:hypothetical protein
MSPSEPSEFTDASRERLLAGKRLWDNDVVTLADIPAIYDRLLVEYPRTTASSEFDPFMSPRRLFWKSFNPMFQIRLMRSSYVRDFLKVPNAIKQDVPAAGEVLRWLDPFDQKVLQALRQCNDLNQRLISRRWLFSYRNAIFVGAAAVLGSLQTTQKFFGPEALSLLALLFVVAILMVVASIIGGYFVLAHKIGLVKALDGILSIALAYRRS